MTTLTRRAFLARVGEQSLTASLAASALLAACRTSADRSSALGLDGRSTETLIALIDEIIPASDGMPAASQAGTLAYFELLAGADPILRETLQGAVRASSKLAPGSRAEIVARLAKDDPALFTRLRRYVCEAYYLQPEVWKLLGYEPFPTGAAGPSMAPFTPELLQRVREMPQRYRAVRS